MQTLSGAKCDDASPHTACCMCVIESGRRRPIFARRHCRNARTLHNGITLSLDIIYICDIKAHSNHKFSEALTVAARTHFFYLSSLLFFLVFVQFLDNNHVTVRRRSPALSPSRWLVRVSSSTLRFKFSLNKQIKSWSRARQAHNRVRISTESMFATRALSYITSQNDTSHGHRVTETETREKKKMKKREENTTRCDSLAFARERAYLLCKYTFLAFCLAHTQVRRTGGRTGRPMQ